MNYRTLFIGLAVFAAFFAFHYGDISAAEVSPSPEEITNQAAQQAKRDRAARRACDGRAFEWQEDGSLICHREIMKSGRSQ